MKLQVPFSLAALLLAASSCSTKDNPEAGLPPATQTGRNTAGCLVNGNRFVATGYGSGLSRIPALYGGFFEDSLYYVELSGSVNGREGTVALFMRSRQVGVHTLNQNTLILYRGGLLNTLAYASYQPVNNTGELYITNAQHNGEVNLTYADVQSGISAGTFSFTAASTFDRTKTVTITSGRFDRKQ